ncbi:MAG: glycosyltransferase family 2 protein [Burkholderiales bacterium]|nr:glycosyltransferase family 2 protein [Burkholderiales bacterium]
MRIAIILTTYNRPDALRAVLEGYAAQTDRGFDVMVADDGSEESTGRLVRDFASRMSMPVEHVWQEDRGFRAAAVRNRAAARTHADYLIFTDGDCVPPRRFVAAHRQLAERGRFVAGNRILLPQAFTRRVLAEQLPIHEWGTLRWLGAWLRRDANRVLPLLRFSPEAIFRRSRPRLWRGVKTCNLGLWREDLLRVNGLDERYEGWGLEDSDLVIRLLHAGVLHKSGRFFAPVFHLWHVEHDRSRLPRNEAQLAAALAGRGFRAEMGLDRYIDSAASA